MDLSEFDITDHNLLLKKTVCKKKAGRPLTEESSLNKPVRLNFTAEEYQKLVDIHKKTGIPTATYLRNKLKENKII